MPALADALLPELDGLADAFEVDRRVTERHRRAVRRMLAMLDFAARRGVVAAALGVSVQPRRHAQRNEHADLVLGAERRPRAPLR